MMDTDQHSNMGKSLEKAFDDWDAGSPSHELWADLEAELSVSAVWDNLDEVLENDHNTTDDTLLNAYERWSPQAGFNGWGRLDEELSRERVWTRISFSLTQFAREASISYLNYAASLILFVMLAFYANFEGSIRPLHQIDQLGMSKVHSTNTSLAQIDVLNTVPTATTAINALRHAQQQVNHVPSTQLAQELDQHSSSKERNTKSSNEQLVDESSLDLTAMGTKPVDLNVEKHINDFVLIPLRTTEIRPRFSLAFGGQLSILNERNLRSYTSITPNMGIAADFQYHSYFRKLRFTQDIGFSQYNQNKGNYINGRFINSTQKLNTLYLSSSVGYTHKNFTLFAGVSLNRLINGIEQNKDFISNIYKAKKMQFGAIVGMDYHFSPFKNKTAVGVGLQYQFVSQVKGENATFNNLQGLKVQLKYSF